METALPFKKALFAQFARIAKVLANGNRLEILELLAQGERTVENLAGAAGLSIANTSQHLQQMRQAGLVKARKEGLHVHYSLNDTDVIELLRVLRGIGERNLEEIQEMIGAYLGIKDDLEAIQPAELLSRMEQGLVTVLDVRPESEFVAGHLPGAMNVPVEQLETRLASLPKDRDIVAYCRGPYCVYSFDAVQLLRQKGYTAHRLEEGYPEWKLAGLPVDGDTAA